MDDLIPMENQTPQEERRLAEAAAPSAAPDSEQEQPINAAEPLMEELATEAVVAEETAPAESVMTEPFAEEADAEEPMEQPAAAAEPSQEPQPAYYQPPFYPPYPFYGAPYGQAPQQAQPPQPPAQYPYYPGWAPPTPPYYPTQPGAVPSYPDAPPYPGYPPQQPPVMRENAPDNPFAQSPTTGQEHPAADKHRDKLKTSTATKAYLITLTAVLVAMIVAFVVYVGVYAQDEKKIVKPGVSDNSSDSIRDWLDDFNNGNNNGNNNSGQLPNSSTKEFEEEITLVEDKGETQQRSDDNADTVGSPDPNAKGMTLVALPADRDNAEYSTQSAYDAISDSVVTVELYEGEITENSSDVVGAGTGTVISADGYIITNAHVIQNSKRYVVRIIMNSGKSYRAKVIGYDTWTDLAVLKIDAEGLTPVVFGDSDLIEIGQDVIAIGSPGGEKFQNSLTKGIVSAIDRELSINKYVRYIQSDAAISPGNSGGPLCNIYGQVIGINTAKTIATYYEAMTFSIPSRTVQEIVNELLHYGYVRGRARIGFSGTEVTSQMQSYGVPAGVVVGVIDESGAFAGTDIREDDVITAIDGEAISSFQDIYAILNRHQPGDKLTFSIYRME